ncbi:helix-turn-helix domain-containing protein [Sphingomonas sp.]|uniref:helix-turn-helix domain-containing protein n=1 Tax=Sphingomonas sp. TaxID=28214 RepID=UPI001EC0A8B0|nr:helix-turn-helix domain-containing protein [Sphingomonas sp.]MBX3594033.1 helix-turn-helix domain-containing protein [Sphingomonas sp.]
MTTFGSLNRALLFAAVARACGPFTPASPPPRPVSINALATSLNRPFETTRRNVIALVDANLLVRNDAGVSAPLSALSDPVTSTFTDRCHDLLVRLIEDAMAAALKVPAARKGICYDPRLGTGVALDLLLSAVGSHDRRESNWTRQAVLLAVEWSSARYGGNAQGTGVKTSVIARLLGMPYATTSRHADALVRRGLLERGPDGLGPIKAAGRDARDELRDRGRFLLNRLAQTGFVADRAGDAYIARRPALPVLG